MTTYIVETESKHGRENYAFDQDKARATEFASTDHRTARVIEVDADAGTAKIIAEFAPEKWERRWLNLYRSGAAATHDTEDSSRRNLCENGITIPIEIDFARGKIRQVEE